MSVSLSVFLSVCVCVCVCLCLCVCVCVSGHSVTLLCHYDVKTHSLLSVCWNRGKLPLSGCKDLLIAVDQLRVREDTRVSSRYQLWGRLDEGDVSLTILNLTETDAGLYGCRVEIPGWLNDEKHNFHLTVDSAPQTTTTPPVNTETSTHQTTAAHTPGPHTHTHTHTHSDTHTHTHTHTHTQ
uniref:Ig-like domain-containing protein n=1 Tax=Scophthalmus maximus TaxID=52904 RepID=A0A8D3AHT0_SCOMX